MVLQRFSVIDYNRHLCAPACCSTHSLVVLATHDTFRICVKAIIIFSSCFSSGYWPHDWLHKMHFVSISVTWLFGNLLSYVVVPVSSARRLLTSVPHVVSSETMDPRCGNVYTFSRVMFCTSILCCQFPVAIALVLSTVDTTWGFTLANMWSTEHCENVVLMVCWNCVLGLEWSVLLVQQLTWPQQWRQVINSVHRHRRRRCLRHHYH